MKNNHFDDLFRRIDETAELLESTQQMNFSKWSILGIPIWSAADGASSRNSYKSEVDYFIKWLSDRIEWMMYFYYLRRL